jgi:hypothetical protein
VLDRREHGGTLAALQGRRETMDANDVLALGLGVDLLRESGEPLMNKEDFHAQAAETFYTGVPR